LINHKECLPAFNLRFEQKGKSDGLICTDKFRSYDILVSYGFKLERIDHGLKFANGIVYINDIEGFWFFAKERLMKYYDVNLKNSHFTSKNWSSGIITGTAIFSTW